MSTARRVVRWLLLGRRDGLRASLRQRLGLFTWLDRRTETGGEPPSQVADPEPPRPDVTPSGPWTELVGVDELAAGEVLEVLVGERPIAVACVSENGSRRYHAVDGVCPHAGGPLGDGTLEGNQLTCPWHGWSYDLETGRSSVDPAVCVRTFETRVDRGRLMARLTDPTGAGGADPRSS
jgi:nitrite reductase/ring-hydroxylating ferredoxin subunit